MNQSSLDTKRVIELAAHKIFFQGVSLPLDLGQGIILRYTDAEESNAIAEYLGFPRRSELFVENGYVCFEKEPEFQNEKHFPLRVRRAGFLLPEAILFGSEIVQLKNQQGELQVGFSAERTEDCGARALETSNYLVAKKVVFDEFTLQRVRKLATYRLNTDAFISSFVSAHNALPSSVFRIVSYMSIVEGLIGTKKETANMRSNIASKMPYFFKNIWPGLELAIGLPTTPHYNNGREITDIEGVWSDLYQLRNLVVHGDGDKLSGGTELRHCANDIEFSALQDATWHDAFDILDFGLKALIYWQLEDPSARESFSQIV